jgi:hypothetical protein
MILTFLTVFDDELFDELGIIEYHQVILIDGVEIYRYETAQHLPPSINISIEHKTQSLTEFNKGMSPDSIYSDRDLFKQEYIPRKSKPLPTLLQQKETE